MPIPIRSSERNISRAWGLVRDMATYNSTDRKVGLGGGGTLDRGIKRGEGGILRAKVRVINVAIDDVGGHALRMQPAAERIGLHADPDQIVGAEHLESLGFGQGHGNLQFY